MGMLGGAKLRDVTDGASNSIGFWEIRAGTNNNDERGTWAMYRGSGVWGCANWGDCNGINDQTGNPDDVHGCQGNTTAGMGCWSGGDGQHGPKSEHVGGCHALFLDGSVHFISQNINMGPVNNFNVSNAGVMPPLDLDCRRPACRPILMPTL